MHTVTERRTGFTQRLFSTWRNALLKNGAGFTLIEMLVYVGMLALMVVVIVNAVLAVGSVRGRLGASRELNRSAVTALERVVRDVQSATSTDDGVSVFGSHPGQLTVRGFDGDGNPATIRFALSGDTLEVYENGVALGELTGSDTRVTTLIFRKIATGRSTGVRVEMTLSAGTGPSERTETLYAAAVLQGSY